MALTLQKLQRLQDASLVGLYNDKKLQPIWQSKAEQAYDYTKVFVKPSGQAVRPDDVLPPLQPALEVSEQLKNYLASKKLSQRYWSQWFGELIIDTLWTQLIRRP
jgi:hypothetical protein